MADNGQGCLGAQDERCLCNMCLDRKLHLLREAPPDVQRSILMHLPPDNLHPIPAPAATAGGGADANAGGGADEAPLPASQQHLHMLSLFKVPLWPTDIDAEFDDVPQPPRNPPTVFRDIVIPPLVRQHIPTIQDCINFVITNAQITGPRKEAAIVEAIDEILTICERKLRGGTTN